MSLSKKALREKMWCQSKADIELNPFQLEKSVLWRAGSIKGAFVMGKPVALEHMSPIDLIVAGSVAVSSDGTRLGKGAGLGNLGHGGKRWRTAINAEKSFPFLQFGM